MVIPFDYHERWVQNVKRILLTFQDMPSEDNWKEDILEIIKQCALNGMSAEYTAKKIYERTKRSMENRKGN